MASDEEDFWPAIEETTDVNAPIVLLRKQANILYEKTNYTLQGEVTTEPGSSGSFVHSFNIVVPALNGYRYELFTITHGIEPYPVWTTENHLRKELASEQEFTAWLKSALSSEKTKRVLTTLLQQVKT